MTRILRRYCSLSLLSGLSRTLQFGLSWLLCAGLLTELAHAQLTIPTAGVLPAAPLSHSIILGDRQATLQSQWAAPINAYQQSWVNTINSRASSGISAGVPATFAAAANDSAVAESAGLRYAMTGNLADLNKSVTALLSSALPANNENDSITHPELLTSYLSAYDFVRGASTSALPAATRTAIESRLQTLTQNLSYGNGGQSNQLAKIGATKALAGELLSNQSLLNTGLNDLQNNFNYSTTNDGWYTDSQGHYLNYTLRHLGLFARAYEQGSSVNLYPNLQPLFDMSQGLRKPDGKEPNVSNGLNSPVAMHFFTNTPDTAAASHMLWNLEQLPVNAFANTNIDNNDYSQSTSFALTNFNVSPAAPTQSPTFLAAGQSAVSVFRTDWSTTSDYLAVSPGVDSPFQYSPTLKILFPAFHSHNDNGEILVASGGKYLLVASGYNRTDLTNSPPGFQSQIPTNHNVILVDGDLGLTNEGRTMTPDRFVHTDRLDSTERGNFHGVGDFATLKMEYGGAQVARSSGFANEDYFAVADRMQATASHSYGFNLIGRGTRTVLTNTPDLVEVKWIADGRQVIEHLVSTHAMSLATSSTYMHDTFGNYEPTQRMTATVTASNAGFLSIIETGAAGDAAKLSILDLSTASYTALRATNASENNQDLILSQSASALRAIDVMTTDAEYAYVRHAGGVLDSAMLAHATVLYDSGNPILQLSQPLTLSLLFGEAGLLGTISGDGFVPGTSFLLFDQHLQSVMLNGSPLAFNNQANWASFSLPTSGELVIQFANVPEPSSLALAALGLASLALAARRRRR